MDGHIDKGGHTSFDAMAILNGKDREPCHYNQKWLEQNVLASNDDLDACSQFYDTLSFQDQNKWIPSGHSCEEDNQEVNASILKWALPKKGLAPTSLQKPFASKDFRSELCLSYPTFLKNRKRTASVLEGDTAEAEINRFDKDFLLNYFVTEAAEADEAVHKRRRNRHSKVAANPASTSGGISCADGPAAVET